MNALSIKVNNDTQKTYSDDPKFSDSKEPEDLVPRQDSQPQEYVSLDFDDNE